MSIFALMNHESRRRVIRCSSSAGSDHRGHRESVFNHSFGRELLITAAARERERAVLILQTRYKIYLQQTGIVFGQRFFSSLKFLRLCAQNQYLTSASSALVFHLMQLYGFLIQSSRLMLRFCQRAYGVDAQ